MVVGFTTTYAISAYHHWCYEFESLSRRGVQHYVIKFVSDLRQIGGFLQLSNCSAISCENKLVFNEMMMRPALYKTNTHSNSFYSASSFADRHVMSPYSDTLSWFRANQHLLFLLHAACLAEKQHISILKSLVWPDLVSNPRSTTLEASTLTIYHRCAFLHFLWCIGISLVLIAADHFFSFLRMS